MKRFSFGSAEWTWIDHCKFPREGVTVDSNRDFDYRCGRTASFSNEVSNWDISTDPHPSCVAGNEASGMRGLDMGSRNAGRSALRPDQALPQQAAGYSRK